MIGALLVLLPAGAAVLYAVSARIPSLVATLLVAYLAFVAEMVGATLVLSPFARRHSHRDRTGRGRCSFAGSVVVWVLRGRPGLPLAGARESLRELVASRLTVVFLALVARAARLRARPCADGAAEQLGHALIPPRRAPAAGLQARGYGWIPNAPTDSSTRASRSPSRSSSSCSQPPGKARCLRCRSTWPSSRSSSRSTARLGGSASGCRRRRAARLSSPRSRSCRSSRRRRRTTSSPRRSRSSRPAFCSGTPRIEQALAGVAVGIGLGVKLTTVFALPVLALLAVARGARPTLRAVSGCLVGFAAVGVWGYALNHEHTGLILGQGQFGIDVTTSPSYPGSAIAAVDLLYETLDLGFLSDTAHSPARCCGRGRGSRGCGVGMAPAAAPRGRRRLARRAAAARAAPRPARGVARRVGLTAVGPSRARARTGTSARRTGPRARTTRPSGRSAWSRSSESRR